MQERTFTALQIIKKTFDIVYMIISVNGISYVNLMAKIRWIITFTLFEKNIVPKTFSTC